MQGSIRLLNVNDLEASSLSEVDKEEIEPPTYESLYPEEAESENSSTNNNLYINMIRH